MGYRAEMTRRHTGTTFYHTLTPQESQTLRENTTLIRNILKHENPGFEVSDIFPTNKNNKKD